MEQEQKRQANFDYILADLIGHSVARIHSSRNKMPSIVEAYPSLYAEEERAQEEKDELSALRFKLFAQSYNQKFKNNKEVLNDE